jgi:hypothetical protein
LFQISRDVSRSNGSSYAGSIAGAGGSGNSSLLAPFLPTGVGFRLLTNTGFPARFTWADLLILGIERCWASAFFGHKATTNKSRSSSRRIISSKAFSKQEM